jgi:DNA-binding XRE family transcriptional regulator
LEPHKGRATGALVKFTGRFSTGISSRLAQTLRVDKSDARQRALKVVEGLAAHRTAAGLSQYRLAELTGLSRETIRQIENGTYTPTLASLFLISEALGAKLGTLVSKAED